MDLKKKKEKKKEAKDYAVKKDGVGDWEAVYNTIILVWSNFKISQSDGLWFPGREILNRIFLQKDAMEISAEKQPFSHTNK